MAMSTEIYIAHKRETSNALYALVRSEHKRFHVSECIWANSRIAQVESDKVLHTDGQTTEPVGQWRLSGNV